MAECENCGAQVLPNSTFCDACGHKLGTPSPKKGTQELGSATPGSLRGELAFLSGGIDQAKAKLDQWKQKGDQSKRLAEHEAEQRKVAAEEARKERKKGGPLQTMMQFLAGLAALAAFIYLLIKLPRKTGNPLHMLMLWQSMQDEFFAD